MFSLLFLYVGLLPDLATLRDRAQSRWAQVTYGVLALGWRGSAQHWKAYRALHTLMACLAIPLVTSVHSIVGLDFAASLMPGWQETIFPPYFVVGALFSGFATVVILAALVRWGLGLHAIITPEHFAAMAKILLMASIAMFYCYVTEWFMAWYGGRHAERTIVAYMFTGDYAPLYWALLASNVIVPQSLWFRVVRHNVPALVTIAVLIDAGMWIERILIIWSTLSHDYAEALWRVFRPTIADWMLLVGPLGFFAFMYLCFVRLFPAVAMHELRRQARQEEGECATC
jgi:molybdopterin-containing oxidoreductase family membrane subunit